MKCSRRAYRVHSIAVTILCTLGVLFASTQHCHAFDGNRNGFVLGFGAGPSYADRQDVRTGAPFTNTDLSEAGLLSNLVIGHGFKDRFMVYYSGLQFWGKSLFAGTTDDGVGFLLLPSIGGRYYLSATGRSLFFGGGIGLSVSDDLGSSELGFSLGSAFHALGGYQFGEHVSGEVTIAYTDPGSRTEDEIWTVALMLGFLAY